MRIRLTTSSEELMERILALEGRWNAVAWSGHEAGTIAVSKVTIDPQPDGTREVTVELSEGVQPPGTEAADFAELGDLTPT